jgi:hypothetical protein
MAVIRVQDRRWISFRKPRRKEVRIMGCPDYLGIICAVDFNFGVSVGE